jgi:hypothetical protein
LRRNGADLRQDGRGGRGTQVGGGAGVASRGEPLSAATVQVTAAQQCRQRPTHHRATLAAVRQSPQRDTGGSGAAATAQHRRQPGGQEVAVGRPCGPGVTVITVTVVPSSSGKRRAAGRLPARQLSLKLHDSRVSFFLYPPVASGPWLDSELPRGPPALSAPMLKDTWPPPRPGSQDCH